MFAACYGLQTIGLRYFNVFGPRQDPDGPYAAVIPRWIGALLRGETAYINGDGETARDFCYVDNVVQANLLAALVGSTRGGGPGLQRRRRRPDHAERALRADPRLARAAASARSPRCAPCTASRAGAT